MNINYFNIIEQLKDWDGEDLEYLANDIEHLGWLKQREKLAQEASDFATKLQNLFK